MRTLSSAIAGVLGAMAVLTAPAAQAATLLSLSDPPNQAGTVYDVAFTATDAITTISFSGYQEYAYEYASGISLTVGGGPNLLGGAWVFTPAALGSDAQPVNDGTPVPALWFGGFTPGYYDTFSQTLLTTPNALYTLQFTFSNLFVSGPAPQLTALDLNSPPSASLLITTSSGRVTTVEAVPEAPVWAMMILGFAGLGLAGYRRARRTRSFVSASCR